MAVETDRTDAVRQPYAFSGSAPAARAGPTGGAPYAGAETDAALMRAVRDGSEEAVGQLYDRFVRQAFAVALRVLGDRAAAEDAVQETFVKVWRSADRFDPARGRLSSWVLNIAHRTAIDALRANRARPGGAGGTGRAGGRATALDDAAEIGDPSADTAGAAEARVLAAQARRALARLNPDQVEALQLAYFEGLTHQEIARRTGAPLGTVKSRLRLALDSLRGVFHDP